MVLALGLTWFLFALALLLGLTAWLVFVWSVRTGQFDDPDGTAQRMLELEEQDLPLPGRDGGSTR